MACGCNKKAKPATVKTTQAASASPKKTYVSPGTGKKFTVAVNPGT